MSIELIGTIKPKNNGDFAIAEDNDIKGGYRMVTDAIALNAIPTERRSEGMLVYQIDVAKFYQLAHDLSTWNEAIMGSSGGFVWSATKTWDQIYSEVEIAGGVGTVYVLNDGSKEMTPRGHTLETDLTGLTFIGMTDSHGFLPTIDIDSLGVGDFILGGHHDIRSKNVLWQAYYEIGSGRIPMWELDGGGFTAVGHPADIYQGPGVVLKLSNGATLDGTSCTESFFAQVESSADVSLSTGALLKQNSIKNNNLVPPWSIATVKIDASSNIESGAFVGTFSPYTVTLVELAKKVSYDDTISSPTTGCENVQDVADWFKSNIETFTSRQISAGTGLTGGGDLSADLTLSADFGSDAGTVCEGDDARLNDSRSPLAHASTHSAFGGDPTTSQRSTGLIKGGVITVNGDGVTFDIAEGWGIIVSYVDPVHPVMTPVHWGPKTGITDNFRTTLDETYVAIDSSGGVVQLADSFTATQRRDYIAIGWTSHLNHATLDGAFTEPYWSNDALNQLQDFLESFGSFNVTGNVFSAAIGLTLQRNSGVTFDNGTNYTNSIKSPNLYTTDPENPVAEIHYFMRDPVEPSGWKDDLPTVAAVDPDRYDDGTGTLASVPVGSFTIQLITYYAPENFTDVQYGQVVYASLVSALAAVYAPVDLDPYNSFDTVRGWLIVQRGCTDLTDGTKAVFVTAGKFGSVAGAGGSITPVETITASNQGLDGQGWFITKAGSDLQFRNIRAASTRATVVPNALLKTVDVDVAVGTTPGLVCASDDSRLADARPPTTHASSHSAGSGDQLAVYTGFAGGQTLTGGTAAGEFLTLTSTNNATKGSVKFGTLSVYDEVNARLGLNQTSPAGMLDVVATTASTIVVQIKAAASQSVNLLNIVDNTSNALTSISQSGHIGVGTASASAMVDAIMDTSSGLGFRIKAYPSQTGDLYRAINSSSGVIWRVLGDGATLSAPAKKASSGIDYGYQLNPTYNQTLTAGSVDILVNRVETALGSGTHRFMDLQIGGVSKFYVNNNGQIATTTVMALPSTQLTFFGSVFGAGTSMLIQNTGAVAYTSGTGGLVAFNSNFFPVSGSGSYTAVSITPTYNQAVGCTGAITDFLINRTETSLGSGAQKFLSLQAGSVERLAVSNNGVIRLTALSAGQTTPPITASTVDLQAWSGSGWAFLRVQAGSYGQYVAKFSDYGNDTFGIGTTNNPTWTRGQFQAGQGAGTAMQAAAVLQADSTTQGFLPPRMTNAQRLAIVTPVVGLMVYCTDVTEGVYVYKSTGWKLIALD